MSNIYVTFSSAFPNPRRDRAVPVAIGSVARTETVVIGSESSGGTDGLLTATSAENVVELTAQVDCWVSIGAAPDPESTNRRLIKADLPYQFSVYEGDKIAAMEV